MSEPWRYRCPKGHACISTNETGGYRCASCGERYAGRPYDAAKTEFPVDEDPVPIPTPEDVLEALVDVCGRPERDSIRARYLGDWTVRQLRHPLLVLEERGLVHRATNGNHGHHWQPTEAGVLHVRGGETPESMDARAHLTPIEHGLLTLFGAMLLGLAVAIANGVVVG